MRRRFARRQIHTEKEAFRQGNSYQSLKTLAHAGGEERRGEFTRRTQGSRRVFLANSERLKAGRLARKAADNPSAHSVLDLVVAGTVI